MAKVVIGGVIENLDEYAQGSKTIARVVEEYTANNGEVWRRKWSVWFDAKRVELAKGDFVEIEGDLSTKVSEWVNKEGQTKQIIDHNVNNPVLVKHRGIFGDVAQEQPEPTRDLDDERKYGRAPF
jgi:uncharacterized Zn ribbon protein